MNLLESHRHSFKASIKGHKVTGHISVGFPKYPNTYSKDPSIFLCQDTVNGQDATDKLGHKYSYTINSGSQVDLEEQEVTHLVVFKTKLTNKEMHLIRIQQFNEAGEEAAKIKLEQEATETEKKSDRIDEVYRKGPLLILELMERIEALESKVTELQSKQAYLPFC